MAFDQDRVKHLEFIQAAITRFATTSFLVKGWVLTIAAAFFALLANKLNSGIAVVGLVPLLTFWALDGYFLWQERLFRKLYDDVRKPASTVEMFSMNTSPYVNQTTWMSAATSKTILLFYCPLVLINAGLIFFALFA